MGFYFKLGSGKCCRSPHLTHSWTETGKLPQGSVFSTFCSFHLLNHHSSRSGWSTCLRPPPLLSQRTIPLSMLNESISHLVRTATCFFFICLIPGMWLLLVCTDIVGRLRLQTWKPGLRKGWETRPDFKYTLKSSHELLSSVVIDSPKLYSAHRKFSTAFNVLRNVIMFG